MRAGILLVVAILFFVIHGASAAAQTDLTGAGAQTKKKTAKPPKAAPRKSSSSTAPLKNNSAANAASLALYKTALARKISDAAPDQVYEVQPQALLRSVVVIRFAIDRNGKLIDSAVQRSNGDPETETAALASLRNAAPFPKPPAKLLTKGRVDLLETWLFNDDGRFQMRSIAQTQKSE